MVSQDGNDLRAGSIETFGGTLGGPIRIPKTSPDVLGRKTVMSANLLSVTDCITAARDVALSRVATDAEELERLTGHWLSYWSIADPPSPASPPPPKRHYLPRYLPLRIARRFDGFS